MSFVADKPKKPKPAPGTPPTEGEGTAKRRRHAVFVTLDDATEARLQRFIDGQRVKPDRAAVAFTALVEFLDRIEAEGDKS